MVSFLYHVFAIVFCLLPCCLCRIWFRTNIYLTADPFELDIHSNQRPEDAVDDFLLLKKDFIKEKAVVYDQIINYVCPHTFGQNIIGYVVISCDNKPPTEVLAIVNLNSFGLGDREVQIRSNYTNDYYVEMICWDKNCSDELKVSIDKKLTETLAEVALSHATKQFESDNYFIVLGLIKPNDIEQSTNKKLELLNAIQDSDIKKAFKSLAIQYHPDKNIKKEKWAAEIFKNISTAYELLINKETRKQHQYYIIHGKYESEVPVPPTQSTFSFNGWNIQFNNENGGFGGGFTFSFNF